MQGRLAIGFALGLSVGGAVAARSNEAALPEGTARGWGAAVAQLIDDRTDWNAERAFEALVGAEDPSVCTLLEAALASDDRQQRQHAFVLLCRLRKGEPSMAQVRVGIEALRSDGVPIGGDGKRTGSGNAACAVELLETWDGLGTEMLDAALASDDWQQRFLSAFLLGRRGAEQHVAKAAAVLLPHLRDNEIYGDAVLAGAGLYGFGRLVLPLLAEAVVGADAQQRTILIGLMRDVCNPTSDARELERRHLVFDVRRAYGVCTVFVPHAEYEKLRLGRLIRLPRAGLGGER